MKFLAVIGGDQREIKVVERLSAAGYAVRVLGSRKHFPEDMDNLFVSNNLQEVIEKASVVIAPMTGVDREGYLKSTFVDEKIKIDSSFFALLKECDLFLIGSANSRQKEDLNNRGIKLIELAHQDELAILNAIPTAEGAINFAIKKTPFTIHGSKILIFGLGKVGLTLAWRLRSWGAEVSAVTRDKAAAARGKDLGLEMISYDQKVFYSRLEEAEIIFNTVPVQIITEEYLSYVNRYVIIIDLASAPGGTDFDAATSRGIKAYLCSGLPGKTAPLTAGKILGDFILSLIMEEVSS